MQRSTNRYAVYWAPDAQSALGAFGNAWLGRNPAGEPVARGCASAELTSQEIETLTAAPARYGFHATLKPPFRLARDTDEAALLQAVRSLAAQSPVVPIAQLAIKSIGTFIAIVPDPVPDGLSPLADACVRTLDRFRAPASADELARRRNAGLTPEQDRLLRRWGYPYVMDEFRFHLTLSGVINDTAAREGLCQALSGQAADVLGPTVVHDLCVFMEPGPDEPFRLIARYPLKES